MALHPLSAEQFPLGLPLPWNVTDSAGQLLLAEGYTPKRDSQIDVLVARESYADTSSPPPLLRPLPENSEARGYDPFKLWVSIQDELDVLLHDIRIEGNFTRQIDNLAVLVQMLAERSPDTVLAAISMSDQRRYPIAHSLHVALLVELSARRLKWDEARRRSLVCAAMTMNLAMLDLQAALCTQRIAPSDAQRREIERHPQLAVDLLREAGVEDGAWLRAVLEHHERQEGGGYPSGISELCDEALLIQTADIFSAKVSPRAARAPITAHEAAKSLFIASAGGEKNPYAAVLIKEVGIFPPGTFVNLANGETALVLRRGETTNTPLVASLVSKSGFAYGTPVKRETAQKEYSVVSVVPRDKMPASINMKRVWHLA
ncbi:MAG TPA: HD domain-containing phosphohydrolase [Rhodocyclaceae bacterium]|nr:HD domain-containing phosphohydrolase [Rhodocyclaceae bacterium]